MNISFCEIHLKRWRCWDSNPKWLGELFLLDTHQHHLSCPLLLDSLRTMSLNVLRNATSRTSISTLRQFSTSAISTRSASKAPNGEHIQVVAAAFTLGIKRPTFQQHFKKKHFKIGLIESAFKWNPLSFGRTYPLKVVGVRAARADLRFCFFFSSLGKNQLSSNQVHVSHSLVKSGMA